jgi:hypothetical protein
VAAYEQETADASARGRDGEGVRPPDAVATRIPPMCDADCVDDRFGSAGSGIDRVLIKDVTGKRLLRCRHRPLVSATRAFTAAHEAVRDHTPPSKRSEALRAALPLTIKA